MKSGKKVKIAIIGGGAAGMIAAATILEEWKNSAYEVHLFEKNKRLGVKVAISGGGRCNVTTGINDRNILLKKYVRGANFLKFALAAFPPLKVREWFEKHGVPLKEEVDKRVFPVSDRGQDIIKVFENIFSDKHIHLHYLEGIIEVRPLKDNSETGFMLRSAKSEYLDDYLVITSGGNAYSKTGSSGDGYSFAKSLGHMVTELGPSLNSFIVSGDLCPKLQAISFNNAKLETKLESGKKVSIAGAMIFTHFGISGPAVFELAAHLAFEKITPDSSLIINFSPESTMNFTDWDEAITGKIKASSSRAIVNILAEFLPKRFIEELLSLLKLKNVTGAVLTKAQRRQIIHNLTGRLTLTVTGRRPGDEFITAGGVSLEEIEAKTMRSRLLENLYFAGEVLDVDGVTGGFNLQSAWATGRLAGLDIVQRTGNSES